MNTQATHLSPQQVIDLEPILSTADATASGVVVFAQIRREPFNGTNARTSGSWMIVAAVVEREAARRMREAYAAKPGKGKT